jgi:hypothetical protein
VKRSLSVSRALSQYISCLVDYVIMELSPQSLFKNLKILDLSKTLVVEIQKGILFYSCHIVRKFLNIDTEYNKTQKVKMWRRDAGNYVDKHCTIT